MANYVDKSNLIIGIHVEHFNHPDLLVLTQTIRFDQLRSAKDGRTPTLVRKLDVPELNMMEVVRAIAKGPDNEVVSKQHVAGKISKD